MTCIRTALLASLALCFAALPARAEPDYTAINTAIAQKVIVPAYALLAETTAAQARAWDTACASADSGQLATLQQAYVEVSDAWATVFHWNFGPVTLLLRRDRFYHWPERRNTIAKGLSQLLAKPDAEKLKLVNFAHTSVAVQGLPALERLVFERTDTLKNAWNCQVGKSIAANLSHMAEDAAKEWAGEVVAVIARGEEHPMYFDGPKATLNKLFTELLTGYAIIKDQKILPVLGANVKKAKPNLIEARRSNRFAENLKLNLETLFAADAIMASYLPTNERNALADKRATAMGFLKALPPLKHAVYVESERAQYLAFTAVLSALRKDMVAAYTTHLGLTIGFNSLDGD